MSAIRAHGLIWKDIVEGRWTTTVELMGRSFSAEAIEVRWDEDFGTYRPVVSELDATWERLIDLGVNPMAPRMAKLGDIECVVYLV